MSDDHKPEDTSEQDRIVKAGGHVTCDGRVNGGLNLSRALGNNSAYVLRVSGHICLVAVYYSEGSLVQMLGLGLGLFLVSLVYRVRLSPLQYFQYVGIIRVSN